MSGDKKPVMVLDCTASGLAAKHKKEIFFSAGRQKAAVDWQG